MFALLLALLVPLIINAQAPLPGFAPPQMGTAAMGGDLGPPFSAANAEACAAACLANSSCMAFTLAPPLHLKLCGIQGECYAPNASSCPAVLTLACPGGSFTAVTFASYGSPTCGAGACAFSANSSCSAPTSVSVVEQACLGRESCSIPVGVSTFGKDPCPGVYKFLAASLVGSGCAPVAPGGTTCQLSQYSRIFAVTPAPANSTYYQKLQPRNDAPYTQAVPYALDIPTGGVALGPGPLATAFDTGIQYLLKYSVDDLLFNFRKRAGLPQPPGASCIGWLVSPPLCPHSPFPSQPFSPLASLTLSPHSLTFVLGTAAPTGSRAPWRGCFSWELGGTCAGGSTRS